MSAGAMTDFRAAMRRTACPQRARQILAILRGRVADAEFIRWPRLVASLKAELADVEQIARARGWVR